jgi:protein-disulfide isomerase
MLSAVIAAYLIVLQFQIGAICRFCMVTDFSALVLAGGALLRSMHAWDLPGAPSARTAGGLALVAAMALPIALSTTMKPRVALPSVIAAEMRKTPQGMVTVVDFVDFECPFCRMTHEELSPVVTANAAKVRLVRKQVPLSMHEHARDAARTACCGELLGQGDKVANALFTSKDLTKEGCEKLAVESGLDLTAYRACIADPKIDQRIEADRAEFKAAQGKGLPTIWVDDEKLEGAQPREKLEAAVGRAISNKS